MNTDKYHQAVAESTVTTDDAAVKSAVEEIIAKHFQENNTPEVHKFLFNTIDLTTLNSTDSPQSVARFTERVNAFENEYPQLPNVAAICVYPNMAQIVRTVLEVSDVEIAAVSVVFLPARLSSKSRSLKRPLPWKVEPTRSTLCLTSAISSTATMRRCATKSRNSSTHAATAS